MLKKFLALVVMLYASLAMAAVVDVNKATEAELDAIKGVGPITSKLIMSERKKGEFKSWQDFIDRVKGVGESKAAKLSEEGLRVGGHTFKTGMKMDDKAAKKDDKAAKKDDKAMAKDDRKDAKTVAKEEKKEARATAKEEVKAAEAKKDAKVEKAEAKKDAREVKEAKAEAKAEPAKAAASARPAASAKK